MCQLSLSSAALGGFFAVDREGSVPYTSIHQKGLLRTTSASPQNPEMRTSISVDPNQTWAVEFAHTGKGRKHDVQRRPNGCSQG